MLNRIMILKPIQRIVLITILEANHPLSAEDVASIRRAALKSDIERFCRSMETLRPAFVTCCDINDRTRYQQPYALTTRGSELAANIREVAGRGVFA